VAAISTTSSGIEDPARPKILRMNWLLLGRRQVTL
jgi:hypothetical protein